MPTNPDPLDQIHAILANPKRAIRSIQIVAKEHGFDDLTEFNAAFRKRFGVSATDVRKAVKRGVRVKK